MSKQYISDLVKWTFDDKWYFEGEDGWVGPFDTGETATEAMNEYYYVGEDYEDFDF